MPECGRRCETFSLLLSQSTQTAAPRFSGRCSRMKPDSGAGGCCPRIPPVRHPRLRKVDYWCGPVREPLIGVVVAAPSKTTELLTMREGFSVRRHARRRRVAAAKTGAFGDAPTVPLAVRSVTNVPAGTRLGSRLVIGRSPIVAATRRVFESAPRHVDHRAVRSDNASGPPRGREVRGAGTA